MTRRTQKILAVFAAGAAAMAGVGCGSAEKKDTASTTASGGDSTTLRIPYLGDMSVPDPDVFYDIEGNGVLLSQYEGLLKYKAGTLDIVPNLATKYEISDDGKTYTFTLRDDVVFHSGPKMTCDSVKAAFERRVDVDAAPAWMLADVKSMTCTDDTTFVIELKNKVTPFLHYMASSWGPKVIGPEAIETNAGKDYGQTFLETKGDGTGPYKLSSFKRGSAYTLTKNDNYWGTPANFKEVIISITPDMGTQRLKLEKGDLDVILHGFPASELESLPDNIKVEKQDSLLRLILYVNSNKAPFNDPEVRAGLQSSIDTNQLVEQGYSDTAAKSTGIYPPGLLPGEPELPYTPDPAKAKAAADKAKTKKLTLGYSADESGVQRRVGELLQAQLKTIGYDVSIKEVQLPQVYGWVKNPKDAPDLAIMTNTPDGAHPDLWASIMFSSTGGLNFFGVKNEAVDKNLGKAISLPPEQADPIYKEIAQDVIDDNSFFLLGDVKNVFVMQDNLTGLQNTPAYPWLVDFSALKRGN
ncbi:MAG: ABC transporter substrate-binding protein [Solirubrobacteraceae bacterium]|nr:ABC transporter substrate-binding protein [Solirubrobacteraceae bacterium]